jgi:hypothetical protein
MPKPMLLKLLFTFGEYFVQVLVGVDVGPHGPFGFIEELE